MTLFAFIGSLALAVFAFELASAGAMALETVGRNRRLDGVTVEESDDVLPQRRSTWYALLLALFPRRFDPQEAKNLSDVISLLRRAGYPYKTPGEFYAAAMRTFSIYLAVGGLLAGALAFLDMPLASAPIAAIFVFLGLRRPYVSMKQMIKKRAEATRNNMLIGLSVLRSLMSAGVGVQEALRRAGTVGGPFCNLLALLAGYMTDQSKAKDAIAYANAHIPDPNDIEVSLFFRDVEAYFSTSRPLLNSIEALQNAVHRQVVDATEERAALVRQRSGLFGILAILGMIFSIVGPFLGIF